MAEVLSSFYDWTRDQVIANLTRVQLLDSVGEVQLSLTTADPRLVWEVIAGNPLSLSLALNGSDADTTGKEFASLSLFTSADSTHTTPLLTESFTAFIASGGTTYEVSLALEIPDIV